MEKETYYLLSFNEDGDPPRITKHTKESLERLLDADTADGIAHNFLDSNSDFAYDCGYLIIKGEIVKPEPKIKVQSWEV